MGNNPDHKPIQRKYIMSVKEILPGFSCVALPDDLHTAITAGYKEIYVITTAGIIKHHQLRGEGRFIRVKVDKIQGYTEPVIKEAMSFLPAGKIPFALYKQIESFFRKVIVLKGTALEAMIFILWNQEQGYHLFVPPQKVGAASVSFESTDLPAGSSIVVNIHSHGHMSAFFSGTDDNNDSTLIQFSGVFGRFQDPQVTTVWRFNYYTKKFAATAEDIFEPPVFPEAEVPQEWLDQVEIRPAALTPMNRGGFSNQGNVGNTPGVGKNWDHLKQYQFPKSKPNGQSGYSNSQEKDDLIDEMNAAGWPPQFIDNQEDDYDNYYNSRNIVPYNPPAVPTGAVWRYNPKTGLHQNMAGQEDSELDVSGEDALARVNEDPTMEDEHALEAGQSHLGKPQGRLNLVDVNGRPLNSSPTDHYDLEMYNNIVLKDGVDCADAYSLINEEMHVLNGKDDLVTSLIPDLFNMISEEGKLAAYRTLFEHLSGSDQNKLGIEGL